MNDWVLKTKEESLRTSICSRFFAMDIVQEDEDKQQEDCMSLSVVVTL